MLGGVRSCATSPSFAGPRLLAQLENLPEQADERLQMAFAGVVDSAKLRRIEPTKLMKLTRSRAALAIRRDE